MAPQTTSTSHVVKHAPWKTAAPAGSISLGGPSATSTALLSRAESGVSSTGGSDTDPTQSSVDDPRSTQETVIASTEPSSTNHHSGDRGTQLGPDPLPPQPSPPPPPIDYEFDQRPVYNVKGGKLTPGGPAVTVEGVQYSLDASAPALLSDSQTISLDSPTKMIPSLTIDQQTVSADRATIYSIGEQTLSPDGPAITISESATALLVGGSTIPLGAPQSDPPPISINGEIYSADTRPRLKFKGSEIVAGGAPVTINNVPYALDPSATALYMSSSAVAVSSLTQQHSRQSQRPDEGALASAPLIIIDSSTTTLQPSAKDQPQTITINSTPYTANPASAFIIGTQTLAPGSSAITINSTRYSLPPLPTTAPPSSSTPTAPQIQAAITVNSVVYTCRQNTPCTIASQVLSPNGTITVGSETLVYGEGGIDVISQTEIVETPSLRPVITSHISGLTPIGEETATPAAGTGTGREEGGAVVRKVDGVILLGMLVGVVGVLLLK
ncbi:MAG: hypothetical protein L6R42_004283 [Xanthoria sp. 1 TBL-2021]|nr:MAG: hypothetical protein L6R42_004283 [Xanthoria sp. 1 TBL-2021]